MAEPNITLVYSDILKEVGYYLGYGRSTGLYTSAQQSFCDDVISAGLRRFINPPPVRPGEPGHSWSFMNPVGSLVTVIGQGDYTLPFDFEQAIGDLTFAPYAAPFSCKQVSGQRIRELRQWPVPPVIYQWPEYYAIEPVLATGTAGQRYQLMLYPAPNAVYTLGFKYRVATSKMSAAYPYPPGGPEHGETILEACLAVAEERTDDKMGVHNQKFMERLAASVSRDRAAGIPDTLGYNTSTEVIPYPRDYRVPQVSTPW